LHRSVRAIVSGVKRARPFLALAVVLGIGALILTYVIRRREEIARQPTLEQLRSQEDAKLLRAMVHGGLSTAEVEAVPTYTDFTRALKRGMVRVVQAQERLRVALSTSFDLLERFPPEGVPGHHRAAYLDQNSQWKQTMQRSTNERIQATKDLQGEMEAFFRSNPKERERMERAFNRAYTEAIDGLRPAAAIIEDLAEARYRTVVSPTSANRARYERARLEFEAWRPSV
jgi:hypothetical protein